ncbi:MAG: hypothetical protein CFE43_15765 [Burkholderiales bacterium PBB3]|nr:MAG: hypothetical protein CFE43_15765 [Burkholderiales bacterium PBB3]
MGAAKALKIKALAGMPIKKAIFYFYTNQALTSAIGLIATLHLRSEANWCAIIFLCISATQHLKAGVKKVVSKLG